MGPRTCSLQPLACAGVGADGRSLGSGIREQVHKADRYTNPDSLRVYTFYLRHRDYSQVTKFPEQELGQPIIRFLESKLPVTTGVEDTPGSQVQMPIGILVNSNVEVFHSSCPSTGDHETNPRELGKQETWERLFSFMRFC